MVKTRLQITNRDVIISNFPAPYTPNDFITNDVISTTISFTLKTLKNNMAWSGTRISRNLEDIKFGKSLVEAAEKGEHSRVSYLLSTGISVNAAEYNKYLFYQSKNYVTPLQVAAANGHLTCVEILIEAQADLNARDRFDVTAVHMAAEKGQYECLSLLLDAGADSNVATKYSKVGCYTATPHPGGTTPLHLASKANHVNCVRELIQNGADYNAVDEHGKTSLFIAAENGYEECVLVHLRNAIGRDILSLPVFHSGETPLHCCVRLRMKSCVAELLEHGSDVNHLNRNGNAPLHCSVITVPGKDIHWFDIMKQLVLHGYNTDVNLNDGSGLTPLHYVSISDGRLMERRPEAAAFLIAYGSNPDIVDKRGNCLLSIELQNGADLTIIRAIIKTLPSVPTLASLNLASLATSSYADSLLAQIDAQMVIEMDGAGDHQLCNSITSSRYKQWKKIEWYKQLSSMPRSLQHCCRYVIRKTMGYRRLRKIPELPISRNLIGYLLLDYDEFK